MLTFFNNSMFIETACVNLESDFNRHLRLEAIVIPEVLQKSVVNLI